MNGRQMNGKLFLVSTPIGNMGDISQRAVETLKSVDFILAEDTRITGKLLNNFNIKKPLLSYHKFSDEQREESALKRLMDGETAALCSDAGMPCISDPGEKIVKKAIEQGIDVVPIPGACAFTTALMASGISTERFAFMGFFPRKKRAEEMENALKMPLTLIYYESPKRIIDAVEAVCNVAPEREIVVARELTKIYEEFIRGKAKEVLDELQSRESIKGEFVLIIAPAEIKEGSISDEDIEAELKALIKSGESLKTAVKTVCEKTGENKNRVYCIGKGFLNE